MAFARFGTGEQLPDDWQKDIKEILTGEIASQ